MRILFVTADLGFPPRSCPQTQTLALLGYLLERGQECSLMALHRREVAVNLRALKSAMPGLKILQLLSWRYNFAVETALALLPGFALIPARPFELKPELETAISEALEEADPEVVHFEGIALAPYLRLASGRPTVLSLTDATSLLQNRLAKENPEMRGKLYRSCATKLALLLERHLLPEACRVHVVSQSDRDYLSSRVPRARVEYIGLPVPRETIALGGTSFDNSDGNGDHRLFFSSDLRVGHLRRGLLWFLSEVYPTVAQTFADVRLLIAGSGAQVPELQSTLASVPGVTFAPWVDDYDAQLRMAAAVIVPDPCGAGAKCRVLRAMALGRPVVGTPAAFEGISVEDGAGGFCCRSAGEFARSLISLLGDGELRRRVGEAGRRFVLEHHAPEVVGKQWFELYERAIGALRARTGGPARPNRAAVPHIQEQIRH